MFQKHVQARGEESGMFRLEHEIVVFIRQEQAGNLLPEAAFLEAMRDLVPKIGAPPPKIIVHVDRWHRCLCRAVLQSSDILRGWHGMSQQFVSANKIEVVDNVDEKQAGCRFRRFRSTFHAFIQVRRGRAVHPPVAEWGVATGLDSGEPFSRSQIERITIAKMARNSLCQFWNDSNQN